jgi:hypothetical protein
MDFRIDKTEKFVVPPIQAVDEKQSLMGQAHRVNRTEPPPGIEKAITAMEGLYADAWWSLPEDFLEDSHIRRTCELVRDEAGDKTPGAVYAMVHKKTSNKQVFEWLGIDGVMEAVRERIGVLESLDLDEKTECSAPVRLFIKRELHKLSKAATKRWRLIWAIDLIDQIVDRLLYQESIDAEIRNFRTLPSKVGLGFMHGTTHELVERYKDEEESWRSFDVSGLDISAPGWGLENFGRRVTGRLCRSPRNEKFHRWEYLSKRREIAVQYGTFVFSDGTHCSKSLACIQTSGRLTTISWNGRLIVGFRCLYNFAKDLPVHSRMMAVMGDDSVQNGIVDVDHFLQWNAEKCGVLLTDESTGPPGKFSDQNFCSREFKRNPEGNWVPVPLNFDKMTTNLCHPDKGKSEDDLAATLSSACLEYAYHCKFDLFYNELLRRWPEKAKSPEWYKALVAGYE